MSDMANFHEVLETIPTIITAVEEEYIDAHVWLHSRKFGPFINGEFRNGGDSEVHWIVSPSTRNSLATVRISTSQDIHNAVASALSAHELLKTYNEEKWFKFLQETAGYLETNSRLFAEVDSLNRGVLISTPLKFDLPAMVKYFSYYANVFYERNEKNENDFLEPMTVGIMTKDTPLIAFAWLLAPAFALKRSVCLVVPKETVLPAMLFAQVCIEGSSFGGILNILPGDEATVDEVVSLCNVSNVISFGPTCVARHIQQNTAGASKLSTALMNGTAQMLVFDTADVVAAVDCAVKSTWHYQGVVPWAVKRVLVEESVFEEFTSLLKSRLESVHVGPPGCNKTEVGPSYERAIVATKLVESARQAGIQVFQMALPQGFSPQVYFPLTVLIGALLEEDDLLGLPVMSVVPFRTPKEGVLLANNARYGLAASIWLENLSLSLAVAEDLKMGTVWINTHGVFDPAVPFGGWKESGTGSFGGLKGFERAFTKNKLSTENRPVPTLRPGGKIGQEYKLHYAGDCHFANKKTSMALLVDGQPFATIAVANSVDVLKALTSSVTAQERWAVLSPAVKAQALHNMAEHLDVQRTSLASSCASAQECHKVVQCVVKEIHWWASSCAREGSLTVRPSVGGGRWSARVSREPLGVVVVAGGADDLPVTVAACLRHGNAVLVVLEAERALPALALLTAVLPALPPGLVNVLTGREGELLRYLAARPEVALVWAPDCPREVAEDVRRSAALDVRPCYVHAPRCPGEDHLTRSKAVWMSKGFGLC